jgi:hypothetical protein
MYRISLLFILCLWAYAAIAQKGAGPVPVYTSDQQPTPFVDARGKVVFEVSAGHRPVLEFPSNSYIITLSGRQQLQAFSSGLCPVRRPDGSYYWIDPRGNTIKEFGNAYSAMSPAREGYVLAGQPHEEQSGASWLLYLNAKGENAFGNRRYWEAGPFSEGYAPVQLQHEAGEWGYIDKSGEIKIRPQLRDIYRLGGFHNGIAMVTTNRTTTEGNYNFSYHYINTSGEVIISLEELKPGRKVFNAGSFSDGLAAISWSRPNDEFKDVSYIDLMGKEVLHYTSVYTYSDFSKGRASLALATPKERNSFSIDPFLIDKAGKRSELLVPEGQGRVGEIGAFNSQFFSATLVKQDGLYEALFAHNGRLVFQTDAELAGATAALLLLKKNDSHYQLLNHRGKLLWQTPVALRQFTSLADALPHKDQVRQFACSNADELEGGLQELRMLQKLTLSLPEVAQLPESLGALQQLRELKLEYMDELTQLPASFSQFQQLERLQISSCRELTGVEALIEQLPNLKMVYLINYELAPGFQERMERERPQLVFDGFSMGMMEIIEMDVVFDIED